MRKFPHLLYSLLFVFMAGCVSLNISTTRSTQVPVALPAVTSKPSFGERQIEQLLDDRPDMQGIITKTSKIYTWVIQQFENGDNGKRISWDYSETISGQNSEYQPGSYPYFPAQIRISRFNRSSGVNKWGSLVYELHNVKNSSSYLALVEKLRQRIITPIEFTTESMKLEYLAMKETKSFLTQDPIPGYDKIRDFAITGYLSVPDTFEDYLKYLDTLPANYFNIRKYYWDYAQKVYDSAK